MPDSGADFANALKRAEEFGLTQKQQLAPLGLMINQTHSIGLQPLQNVRLTTTFYRIGRTRRAPSRSATRQHSMGGSRTRRTRAPTVQLCTISRRLPRRRRTKGEAVVRQMKNTPANDFEMKNVRIRADGQVMRPLYAARIKASNESKYPDDYYEITRTIPAEDAWRPAADSACNLLKTQ